jgi:predicted RNA-binding Zn-ribbon protein involved in translation (DUF1610 family)
MSTRLCPDPDPENFGCRTCGRQCEPTAHGWRHAIPRCGAVMRNAKVPCARYAGHGYEHRTAYALANAAHPTRWLS